LVASRNSNVMQRTLFVLVAGLLFAIATFAVKRLNSHIPES